MKGMGRRNGGKKERKEGRREEGTDVRKEGRKKGGKERDRGRQRQWQTDRQAYDTPPAGRMNGPKKERKKKK